MTDFAVPNDKPGRCAKCNGSGLFRWAGSSNGRPVVRAGACHSCNGTGKQTARDIRRNVAYNRFKLSNLSL